jgi:hypothetical protein
MDTTLSLECGKRLCMIKGGKMNGKIIHLYDKRKKCCSNCGDKCKGQCCNDCIKLQIPDNNEIDSCKIPENDKGVFLQMPTNEANQSDVIMINGRRGCGKSWYMADFLKMYIKCFPKQKIFLFSQCKSDELLDDLITKRINLEDYVAEGGLEPDDFPENSCVCFDDIDMLNDDKPDKLKSKIFSIMNSLIQLSRKRGITVIQTSHITTNHGETKHALNGCSSFTFFLSAVSHQIKNALKIYLGLSNANIKKILSLKNSRSATLFTTSPMICMTEKEIFIVKN